MKELGMPRNIRLEPFDPQTASDALWEKHFALQEALFKELNPEDPPPSRKIQRAFMEDPSPFWHFHRFIAVEAGQERIVASAVLAFETERSPSFQINQQLCHGEIGVHPDRRRRGIGTALLRTLVVEAKGKGKAVLEAGADHASGKQFCQKWGGTVAIEGAENRLKLAEVDWEMLDAWRREGPQRASGVRLEMFQDVPDADIEEYTRLYTETMNQQPLGELEGRAKVTPESRRIAERRRREKGYTWITLISREPDGAISGLTEVLYSPEEPYKIHQDLTGVKEVYRGRGLGKWLKAEMAFYIKEHYPDVQFIATGNATTNAPMLSINQRMGFKQHIAGAAFKFQVEELAQRLGL
jgi:mycothiol synthase